jgi:hypothetical protein
MATSPGAADVAVTLRLVAAVWVLAATAEANSAAHQYRQRHTLMISAASRADIGTRATAASDGQRVPDGQSSSGGHAELSHSTGIPPTIAHRVPSARPRPCALRAASAAAPRRDRAAELLRTSASGALPTSNASMRKPMTTFHWVMTASSQKVRKNTHEDRPEVACVASCARTSRAFISAYD